MTAFQARAAGIRPEDVAAGRPVDQVLAELEAALPAGPLLLVAQHAPVEAGLLYDARAHCPQLARTPLLDTLRLAKALHPGLPDGYGLDALILALNLRQPMAFLGWPPPQERMAATAARSDLTSPGGS